MIKKISEDRRSDIIAARDAWQADYDMQKQIHDNQVKQYNLAHAYICDYLEKYVKNAIGETSLQLRINVDSYGGSRIDGPSYAVRIDSDDFNKFDEDVALSWNWNVTLDKEGNPVKDSGSWSGLKATTPDQLDSLTETLRVLKLLNGIDWAAILGDANRRRPEWSNYVNTTSPNYSDRPNFENQLKVALIDDIMGKPILVQGAGNHYKGNDIWYLVVGETPKQYKIVELAPYSVRNHEELGDMSQFLNDYLTNNRYADGITKDKFLGKLPKEPVTKEF